MPEYRYGAATSKQATSKQAHTARATTPSPSPPPSPLLGHARQWSVQPAKTAQRANAMARAALSHAVKNLATILQLLVCWCHDFLSPTSYANISLFAYLPSSRSWRYALDKSFAGWKENMSCCIRWKVPLSSKPKYCPALPSKQNGEALLWHNTEATAHHCRRAMIKTAATNDEKMCLRREHRNYGINDIASSPYIRALCDTVRLNEYQDDPSCLVFEWMDHDLQSITAPEFRGNPTLPKVMSKAVLSALNVLKTLNAVHTGIGPYSIAIRSTKMVRCQSEQHLRLPYQWEFSSC